MQTINGELKSATLVVNRRLPNVYINSKQAALSRVLGVLTNQNFKI